MRLMLMSVKGMGLIPYKRLVSVNDKEQFIALMRITALKQLIRSDPDQAFHADLLRELRVTLKDTGLDEYPETPQEVEEIFRRM